MPPIKSRPLFQPLDLVLLAVLVAGGWAVWRFHYQITDWYYLRNYHPPAAVAALASEANLTPTSRNLFYRANPQLVPDRSGLVKSCSIPNDKTIELGCYLTNDHIYLLDIGQPQLSEQMVVTAAHETLHAAYDRLSASEKRQLNTELEQQIAQIHDSDLQQRLADYATTEPGERDNELHSILGTEYAHLSPALESHYAQYFADRAQIVADSQQFKQTFDGLRTKITQLDAQIKDLKATMQSYLAAGEVRLYNSQVPSVNAVITQYNQDVDLYNQYSRDLLGQESGVQ